MPVISSIIRYIYKYNNAGNARTVNTINRKRFNFQPTIIAGSESELQALTYSLENVYRNMSREE